MEHDIQRYEDESIDAYLWRLGQMRENKEIVGTWLDFANIINHALGMSYEESYWRKRYAQMKREKNEESLYSNNKKTMTDAFVSISNDIDTQRRKLKAEREALNRQRKILFDEDSLHSIFRETIQRFEPIEIPEETTYVGKQEKAIYAMLSDLHYGISFDSYMGRYNTEIAKQRVMQYADAIIQEGVKNDISTCYVSLMGDMISGNIHTTLRVENKERIVEQIIGASELIGTFLYRLAQCFEIVHVNSVPGNHSRIHASKDEDHRSERLDDLIFYYCTVKLDNCENVIFHTNEIDSTIGSFKIFGKNYVCIHGDMDQNLNTSYTKISRMTPDKIHYLLFGHMHVMNCRIDSVGTIGNGSVCGSGDDYTVRNRLFAKPMQVFMTVNEDGVESIHPVVLR